MMGKVWSVPERAEKKFTDRENPRKAFWDKYTYLQGHMDENILLTYYGIGGIGKTSLIEQLCAELTQQNHLFAVVDLESTESKGKTKILRTLATQLVKDPSIKLFRFLAGMRWYAYNTGAPEFIVKEADELLDDNRMLAGISEWIEAIDTTDILKALGAIVPILPGVGPFVQFVRGIDQFRAGLIKYKSGRKVAQFLSALKINENQPRKIEEELHIYFRDDLIDAMSNRKEPLVIFLDTYEVFTNIFQDHSVAIRNEQWLKEIIPYVPGVLWVISGRDKLEWEDRYEAEQHLLGNLSEKDACSFLVGAGIREEFTERLYKLTQGVPVYLDICVDRHQELVSEGKMPTISDFGETTEKLIERYLRHMPIRMRTLAYVLSCFQKWTKSMVEKIAGKSHKFRYDVTEYNEFMKHSYIVKSADGRYYMHDIMQNTIYNDKEFDPGLKNEINTLLENYFIEHYNSKETTDKTGYLGGCVQTFVQLTHSINEATVKKFEDLRDAVAALYDRGQLHDQLIYSKELYDWAQRIPDDCDNASCVYIKIGSLLLLAKAYSDSGVYGQAATYAQRALDISMHCFGEDHPSTIDAMHNLASSLRDAGRHQDALDMRQKVLELSKRVLGKEHPDTIGAMNNLAVSLEDAGRHQDALDMRQKVLELYRRVLGEEHPFTISAMHNLASSLAATGRHQDALDMDQKALELYRRVLGEEHPDTIHAMNNLAVSLEDAGRHQDALDMRQKVLELYRRVLGEEHPDTIRAMNNVAVSMKGLGRHQEEYDLFEKTFGLCKRILGENHPDTIMVMGNLAVALENTGHHSEAASLKEKVIRKCREELGEKHPTSVMIMNYKDFTKI